MGAAGVGVGLGGGHMPIHCSFGQQLHHLFSCTTGHGIHKAVLGKAKTTCVVGNFAEGLRLRLRQESTGGYDIYTA